MCQTGYCRARTVFSAAAEDVDDDDDADETAEDELQKEGIQ